MIPAEPRPEGIIVRIDKREQNPLDVSPLQWEPATLPTGDYTIRGLESSVAVERKSLDDLIACCGRERDRFDREVQRLLAYPVRCLVIESDWPTIERGEWRGSLTPAHVTGSVLGWIAQGLPVLMCGDHKQCGRYVARLLFIAARRRWREARSLLALAQKDCDQ